jgi:enoyl-CoA hydratase
MTSIKTEVRGHVLLITLARPEARNAFNLPMAQEMEAVVDRYEDDASLRCAVLCAEGATFCAGQDLKAAARGEFATTSKRGGFGILRQPPTKPLIAAIDGQALAGGMELTLCCDLVVASTHSVFGLSEVKRGLVAVGGGCFRLPRRLPYPLAMELILAAEPMPAEKLYQHGFINRLVEPERVLDEALAMAQTIARCAPMAVRLSKEIAARSGAEQWSEQQAWDAQELIIEQLLRSSDMREGLRAFAEKREPVWTGA